MSVSSVQMIHQRPDVHKNISSQSSLMDNQHTMNEYDPELELDHRDVDGHQENEEDCLSRKDKTFLEDNNYHMEPSEGNTARCKKVGQYLLGCTIGQGSYGKVRLATHLISKQRVAVKVVAKKTLVQKEAARRHFRREALMMQRVQHPHVTRLYQALETGNSYYLVFELAAGGSLLHALSRRGTFSEQRSRHYVRQIVSALDHLHKSDIVHRDLKLENILLDEYSNVKLVDFGLSAVCQDSSSALSTQCGSPLYAAPELFAGRKYGKAVDVWSLGVCLYALLAGRLPFLPGEGASLLQLYSLLLKGCQVPQHLSQPCKDLLTGMLEVHESRRLSLDEICIHPWLTGPKEQPIKRVPPVPKKLHENTVDLGIVKYICTTFRFSERDVVSSVTERKLTPAAATYHILRDSIESGRLSISHPREANLTEMGTNKKTPSASATNTKREENTPTDNTAGDISHVTEKSTAHLGYDNEETADTIQNNEQSGENGLAPLEIGKGESVMGEQHNTDWVLEDVETSSTRRKTSESTDSGVGVDFLMDETKRGSAEPTNPKGTNSNLTDHFSYKTFIMDLRQSRQKCRTDLRLKSKTNKDGIVVTGTKDGNQTSNYVLLGHSPRSQNIPTEETKSNAIGNRQNENTENDPFARRLTLPSLNASFNGSFSPTFPPIAISGPTSPSQTSSPVYSTISGLGQQSVNYNTFISSNGGSFYYSSKPIPGFRHGNRYFLHLDKSNFTTCNMGVNGVLANPVNHDRLSCESFAPQFLPDHNAALGKVHNMRDPTGYTTAYSHSHRPPPNPPPPPPNSTSCTPFSYLSGEKIELKAADKHRKCVGQCDQVSPSPQRLCSNISPLQVYPLNSSNKHSDKDKAFHGSSELYSVYSHTDFNSDVSDQDGSKTLHTSGQQQRRPVRILASLRDLYGVDSWKRSKSERADLSRAVKRGHKNRLDGAQSCDILPKVCSPEYNKNQTIETSRKSRPSRSTKSQPGDKCDQSFTRLTVPQQVDNTEVGSPLSRSNISTPLTPDREEFMMPVTSVTIRTIGRH